MKTYFARYWRGHVLAYALLLVLLFLFVPAPALQRLGHDTPLALLCTVGGYILGAGPVMDWILASFRKKGRQ